MSARASEMGVEGAAGKSIDARYSITERRQTDRVEKSRDLLISQAGGRGGRVPAWG